MSSVLSRLFRTMRAPAPLRRLAGDRQGTVMVEFGLLAVPFLATLLAIFEIGYVVFEGEMLQAAITTASRQMLTGQMQMSNVTSASQFVTTYLCPTNGSKKVPNSFDCSQLVVDVRPSTNFTSADLTNTIYKSGSKFCPGGPNQISVMRVTYPLRAIFPFSLFKTSLGVVTDVPGQSGSFHILMGEAVYQTENFAASYTPPAGC